MEDRIVNNYDRKYKEMVEHVISKGARKKDRTGTGTYSVFGYQLRHDMREGFPLLTTKKVFTKSVLHELLWFLQGGDNIKYLVDNGVNIWNEWPHARYNREKPKGDPEMSLKGFAEAVKISEPFAEKWGGLGAVYGRQWVRWRGHGGQEINQLQDAIDTLKRDPDSRRILVTAWNPTDVPDAVLPPCHWAYQFWTRELTAQERVTLLEESQLWKTQDNYRAWREALSFADSEDVQEDIVLNAPIHTYMDSLNIPKRSLSLMFQMRSVDCFLGMPFDIASYGILLSMVAQCVNMVPEELVMNSADTHVYVNHLDAVEELREREPYPLPTLVLNPEIKDVFQFGYDDVTFKDYVCHPQIKAPIAV